MSFSGVLVLVVFYLKQEVVLHLVGSGESQTTCLLADTTYCTLDEFSLRSTKTDEVSVLRRL